MESRQQKECHSDTPISKGNFAYDMVIGEAGELHLKNHLEITHPDWILLKVPGKFSWFDYIVVSRTTGKLFTVEVKYDLAWKATGNVGVGSVSISPEHTRADYFIYLLDSFYFVSTTGLRALATQFPLKSAPSNDPVYCVPLEVFKTHTRQI